MSYKFIAWWPCGGYQLFTDEEQMRKSFPKGEYERKEDEEDIIIDGVNYAMIMDVGRNFSNKFSHDYESVNKLGVNLYPYMTIGGSPMIHGPVILYPKDLSANYIDLTTIKQLTKLHNQGWYDVYVIPVIHEVVMYGVPIVAVSIPIIIGIGIGKFVF